MEYQNEEFFKLNPTGLQLQIAYDDLEICSPLQSKANHHKVCSVYLSIHNVPVNFQSKLKNIHLACLCNTDDLKSKQTDINNIWQLIHDEISILEADGINTYDGRNVKGALVHVLSDNLGYNTGLGFCGGFNAHKYCRHCLQSRQDCRNITRESECILRSIENYEESLDIIAESESVNFNETNGVKFYQILNISIL